MPPRPQVNEVQSYAKSQLSSRQAERATLDAVLGYYGPRSAQWLSDLTHREEPWKEARRGLPEGERGNREISLESMMDYYSSLPPDAEEGR